MKNLKFLLGIFTIAFITSCSSDNAEIDTEYPVIDITQNAFPIQCSTIERGQTITFKAIFNDNVALGSYSLDIHHNFDHHTHSTEVASCEMEAVKKPVKPMLFINNYTIPNGVKSYEATAQISIPADVDPGDYHFMIRLTDKEGWQTLKGLSIKIL
ncbi:DUF4625 domain-containing protein [Flavobacterium chungbukense]|uniref:DUF4625 domain-containing protein n=1 Tax=Flavobacterium chungbukense TaxID=877464 RepID=A0ABP7XVW7_9FLAO|nr:DUF4625 domain-containing protein [Flavobacterium chungbukense]MCC4921725.1 DUF4625 domain-containing protein [Flavobacterium chungbukense]